MSSNPEIANARQDTNVTSCISEGGQRWNSRWQQRNPPPVVLLEVSSTIFGEMVRNRRRSNIPHLTPETTQDPSAQIHAPFDRLEEAELERKVDQFILETGLSLYHRHFRKGAFIAQNDSAFDGPRDDRLSLLEEESSSLQDEKRRRWKHPRTLWALVIVCAIGAATQGWDESAIDGGKAWDIMPPYLPEVLRMENINQQKLTSLIYSTNILHWCVWDHRKPNPYWFCR